MFFRNAAASFAAAGFAATTALAQSSNVATEIATALLEFQAQGLIPQPVPENSYNLSSGLVLSFGGTNATTGTRYTLPSDDSTLAQVPVYQLDVPASEQASYAQKNFTIMLVDPGSAGRTQSGTNVTRHYLANNLKYQAGKLVNTTAPIQEYAEPAPAAADGAHRYVALVFDQGDDFEAPDGLDQPGVMLNNMTLADYIDDSDIGKIVAMSFIYVENTSQGEQTYSSTSSVPSASVAAVASSVASSVGATTGAASATSSSTSSGGSSGASGSYALLNGRVAGAAGALAGAVALGVALV